jgi:hypothetical protein
LKRLKIDVVSELHELRREHAGASSEEIEKVAAQVLEEIRRKKK